MSQPSIPSDEEAAILIKDCSRYDTEAAHCYADDMLCQLLKQLGYIKTVEAFEALDKWYA